MARAKVNATSKVTANKATNTRKAKVETMKVTINGIEVSGTEKDIMAIINAYGSATERTSKGTQKSAKQTAPKTTTNKGNGSKAKKSSKKSAPATRAEAIEMWCESKGYTEEDRAAYGEAIREITDEMRAENAKMVKTDRKGNKTYDDNYYVGMKWKREFNRRLTERGFGKRYKNA